MGFELANRLGFGFESLLGLELVDVFEEELGFP